eukprot:Hpha_TRINITY_DN14433_c0_g1::TRINITY_DN14433_c0_g1_i2::g.157791::m.157791
MATLQLFVCVQGGSPQSVEVPAAGTVQDVIDEAERATGERVSAVVYQGQRLNPTDPVADSGVSREALLEAVTTQPVKFRHDVCGQHVQPSEDGRRLENKSTSGHSFCFTDHEVERPEKIEDLSSFLELRAVVASCGCTSSKVWMLGLVPPPPKTMCEAGNNSISLTGGIGISQSEISINSTYIAKQAGGITAPTPWWTEGQIVGVRVTGKSVTLFVDRKEMWTHEFDISSRLPADTKKLTWMVSCYAGVGWEVV